MACCEPYASSLILLMRRCCATNRQPCESTSAGLPSGLLRLGAQLRSDSCRNFLLHAYQKVKTSAERQTCRSNAGSPPSNKCAPARGRNRIMADLQAITDKEGTLYQAHQYNSPNLG